MPGAQPQRFCLDWYRVRCGHQEFLKLPRYFYCAARIERHWPKKPVTRTTPFTQLCIASLWNNNILGDSALLSTWISGAMHSRELCPYLLLCATHLLVTQPWSQRSFTQMHAASLHVLELPATSLCSPNKHSTYLGCHLKQSAGIP